MYKINFEKPIHIHFIGIGGISMSGLAEILLEEGFTVSGSDSKESPLTKKLESEGAIIHYGQCAENISLLLSIWKIWGRTFSKTTGQNISLSKNL